jgi:hypothetical protein
MAPMDIGYAGPTTQDALLGALAPLWQVLVACCVLIVSITAGARLVRRGRSRMGTAMMLTGTVLVVLSAVVVLGIVR